MTADDQPLGVLLAESRRTGALTDTGPARFLRWVGGQCVRLPRAAGVVLTLAWMGVIFTLSSFSRPVPEGVRVPLFLNDLAHAPLFGMIAFLALIALPRRRTPFPWPQLNARRVVAILVGVALYGISDELHQSTTPGRDASAADVLTDVIGAASVLWIAANLGRDERLGRGLWIRLAVALAACSASAWLAGRLIGE
ncbi:MAG: VanZ family protein [Planctomycetota bacterium]